MVHIVIELYGKCSQRVPFLNCMTLEIEVSLSVDPQNCWIQRIESTCDIRKSRRPVSLAFWQVSWRLPPAPLCTDANLRL